MRLVTTLAILAAPDERPSSLKIANGVILLPKIQVPV
jgi:hypothetical protein